MHGFLVVVGRTEPGGVSQPADLFPHEIQCWNVVSGRLVALDDIRDAAVVILLPDDMPQESVVAPDSATGL